MPITLKLDERFAETKYVCYPVDEKHELWYRWHHLYGLPWKDEGAGFMHTIGKLDKRPVVVTVWWADIAGSRVAFVEAHSQVVDREMIERWVDEVFPNARYKTNPTNFHNIVHPIADELGVESLFAKDVRKVEDAIRNVPRNPSYMRPRAK